MEEQKSRLNIQWFPGHMTKAKRQMEEHLKMVDMVIELRDARIPDASKNPLIDELTAHKPRLILLSKKDKAEAEVTAQWVSALEKEEVRVLAVDLLHEKLEKKITAASQELMQAKIERMKRRGMRPRAIRAMVAGVPNVGKLGRVDQQPGAPPRSRDRRSSGRDEGAAVGQGRQEPGAAGYPRCAVAEIRR